MGDVTAGDTNKKSYLRDKNTEEKSFMGIYILGIEEQRYLSHTPLPLTYPCALDISIK